MQQPHDAYSIYTTLLAKPLLYVSGNTVGQSCTLNECRHSTRIELCRRLSIGKEYIDTHISSKITLEEVAKVSCLSLHHFKRTFRTLYGYAPHHYLVRKRMERACVLLITGSDRIDEIALACGFENTSAFIRQFRTVMGTTPNGYRRSHC